MEHNFYNFSPVAKVPKRGTGYEDKNVEDWNWLDFWNYFRAEYLKTFKESAWTSIKYRNSRKKIIEQSYEYYGKDVFKAMIDWLFDNYEDYPQWNEISIGLVCGSHYWAKKINKHALEQMELDRKWKR